MTHRKLVDPIHLFDSQGASVMNNEFLAKRVDQLTAENAKLKRLLTAQLQRNGGKPPDEKIRIH